MKSNIGKSDRLIRTALAFIIIFGSIYIGGFLSILGVVILLTALIGWCPIYALFGLCSTKEQEEIPPNTSGEHQPRRGPKRWLK
jgi:hypothetical protein